MMRIAVVLVVALTALVLPASQAQACGKEALAVFVRQNNPGSGLKKATAEAISRVNHGGYVNYAGTTLGEDGPWFEGVGGPALKRVLGRAEANVVVRVAKPRDHERRAETTPLPSRPRDARAETNFVSIRGPSGEGPYAPTDLWAPLIAHELLHTLGMLHDMPEWRVIRRAQCFGGLT